MERLQSSGTHYPAYDVFINHRGPDVKNSFASHLYRELYVHGLQPFLDREELQAGELLSLQIEGAIKTSYVHIVIFSPRYADSSWCLDELLLIQKKPGDTIIPVFYNVKPSEVRWASKDGQYAQALKKLEDKGRYDGQTFENWRKALNDVSYRIGFELEAYNGDERKLMDNVVQCVLKNRRKIGLNVARYPTGLEDKVEDFEKALLLQQQSGKVNVLGIVGMGGIGKTTLAKELFNKKSSNFGESSFLFDVREKATGKLLNSLQRKLIKDLTHRDVQIDHVDEGVGKLKTYLSTSRHRPDVDRHALDDVDHADQPHALHALDHVDHADQRHVDPLHALVVLDDVDHADQLQAFLPIQDVLCSDSLILVTSRYKDVLTSSGIAESSIYNLTALNERHSQELFCLHAFFKPYPPPEFKDLVDQFCRASHGLPLSLKVFGGLLCQKNDKSYWEGLLDELKLPKEIHQTLKLSYDALDEEEKEIFLDIACYFIGEDRDMAITIWEGSGWNGPVRLRNLQDKCLVEVDGENTIKMHDHLRDLGRQIADEKNSCGVIPQRLWRMDMGNIHDLWQQSSVITEVRGIRTAPRLFEEELSWFKSWCHEVTKKNPLRKLIHSAPFRFRKLQLVAAEDGDLESILTLVELPNLIWVRWNNCPYSFLPSWIPMKNLRTLELEGNKLQTLWQEESQAPLELRQLHISAPLSKFPKSIGLLRHIEKIVLSRCNLKSLPEEFSHLLSLKYLLLGDSDLRSLQVSFGCLTNLQHLDLHRCKSLQGLPDSFGCLTSLQHLVLRECSDLQGLPDSFGCLASLQHLDLRECSGLQGLPDSFGCLASLQHLDLRDCRRLQELPYSFGCLVSLQHLDLYSCDRLQRLPDSFGCLTSLKHLDLAKCSQYIDLNGCDRLQGLPDSFECLTSLQHLDLTWCHSLRGLPDSFGWLIRLQHLNLNCCRTLQGLPDSFGCLTSLQHLNLNSCARLEGLPDSFGCLTSLQHLDLHLCNSLQGLPDSFGCLTSLQRLVLSQCSSLQGLPDSFGCLTSLQRLDLYGCDRLEGLPDSFGYLTRLKHLNLRRCLTLQGLPDSFGCLTSLQHLDLTGCNSLRGLPGSFGCLTRLQHLDLSLCQSLQRLPDSFGCLTSLQHLALAWCDSLRELPGSFGCLTRLQHLYLLQCQSLQRIPDSFGCLTSLQHLDLRWCQRLRGLPDSFGYLTSLQYLGLSSCPRLQELPDSFGCLTSLQHLNLYKCNRLQGLPDSLGCLTSLKHLDLSLCESLLGLPDSFVCLTSLQHLDLSGCKSLEGLPDSFGYLTSLQHLDLNSCDRLQGLPDSFGCLTNLKHLNLTMCRSLQRLPESFGCLKNLQHFRHFGCGIPHEALQSLKCLRRSFSVPDLQNMDS